MAHKHEPESPLPLESLVTSIGELEVVLGKQVAPTLAAVRSLLIEATAARGRGDMPGAIVHIGHAMDRLSTLADALDPAEAQLMRALAHSLRAALLRGDESQAKESAAVMFEKSGAVERKRETE